MWATPSRSLASPQGRGGRECRRARRRSAGSGGWHGRVAHAALESRRTGRREEVVAQVVRRRQPPPLLRDAAPAARSPAGCRERCGSIWKKAAAAAGRVVRQPPSGRRADPRPPRYEDHPSARRRRGGTRRPHADTAANVVPGERPAASREAGCRAVTAILLLPAPQASGLRPRRAPVSAPVGQTMTHCPQNVQPEARSVSFFGTATPGSARRLPSRSAPPAVGRRYCRRATHRPQPMQRPGSRLIRPSVVAVRLRRDRAGEAVRTPASSHVPRASPTHSARTRRNSGPRPGSPKVQSSLVQPSRSGQLRQMCGCRRQVRLSAARAAVRGGPHRRCARRWPASPEYCRRGPPRRHLHVRRTARIRPIHWLGPRAPGRRCSTARPG